MKKRLEILESQASLPAWEDSLEKRIKMVEAATQEVARASSRHRLGRRLPGLDPDSGHRRGDQVRRPHPHRAVVLTLDPLGTDDRFLTNSIPVGRPRRGEAKRTNISARASRLNIEFRTPTGAEEVRAFFEGDFAGQPHRHYEPVPPAPRLRAVSRVHRRQTWSTFSDPWVDIEDLDFEGISPRTSSGSPGQGTESAPACGRRHAPETPSLSVHHRRPWV